ncbi:MAG: hypothetical protein RSE13_07375 [Planktothrix sp. GU0601_MAG3]|nr:MAG: hypothetical protein RSE13_07375 [Planktothrix sp. GU0601_MAG3]
MFENPSIQTQAPSEVAPQRSVEEPLEDGDYPTPKPADLEAKTEEESPVDQYSDSGIVAETQEEIPSTDESKLDEYLLSPTEAETPVTGYSDDNYSTVVPYTPPEPSYPQNEAGTLPPEIPSAEGGGYVSEQSAPDYYTEPTPQVESTSPILSEETAPINSAPNYGTDPGLPYSPLTIPLKN